MRLGNWANDNNSDAVDFVFLLHTVYIYSL